MTIEEMKKLNPSELLKVRMEEWKKNKKLSRINWVFKRISWWIIRFINCSFLFLNILKIRKNIF